MPEITISKQYKWLHRVPKHAIVDFLQSKDEALVREAIRKLDDNTSGILLSMLIKFDSKQLIYIFQACTTTTPEEAKDLYRQYRYRGMKNLHLYSREGKCNLHSLNKSAFNRVINTKVSELTDSSKKFCDLVISGIESIHNGSIREFSYSYCRFIPYIPPETEYPSTVTDLRRGFIWIPYHDPWICICTKDVNIAKVLHESLQEYLGFKSKALPLTKTVQQKLENIENLRKAGYLSLSGTTRRLANPKMINDPEAMQECRHRDSSDDRPLAGFNVDLDGITFALSYNESGYIYLSRDLTVDQMREWGVKKIREIVQVINDLKLTKPSTLLGESLSVLKRVRIDIKASIIDIASAIMRCKKENISDAPLKNDVFVLADKLGNYIKTRFRVYCSKCNDYSEIVCDCGNIDDFLIGTRHIRCKVCNTLISKKVSCFEGHKNNISQIEECIELLPLSRLNDLITSIFEEATDLNFIIWQESFSIKNNRLFYRQDESKTVYKLSEIPQFKQALIAVPDDKSPAIRKAISNFKEKCDRMGTENCANCIKEDIGKKCYLRLFGLFDPNYEPRPHQGHEFGDYSTLVNIENKQKTMVIAMKSSSKRKKRAKKKVSLRDGVGSDLYSQVGAYLHDGSMDIIGICLPKKLEEGFAAMLKKDVQDKNKKLVIIDDDDLTQIAYSVMQRKNLQLEDI